MALLKSPVIKALLILLGLAVIFNFVSPADNGAAKKGTILPLADAQKKTDTANAEWKTAREQEETLQPKIDRIAYDRPANELAPRVVRDLQRIAKESNIRLQEIKPGRAKPLASGQGARVPIDVRFRAPFQPNVTKFLYNVEAPEGRMSVEKFNVTAADAKTHAVDVSAQIVVFTKVAEDKTKEGGTSDAN